MSQQFCCEDVPLDYQVFTGAVTYLLRRIEADPIGPITEFELTFAQRGHPSYGDIWRHAEWLLKMTQRCCFSLTSFLGALIYIERLRRQRKLVLYESTWRSTWVAMCVLSEKRWEDNYVHPGHIHATYGSKHTSEDQLMMQLKLFKALDFHMAIGYDEFTSWLNRLRDEKDQQISAACHFQRVFIPRPIPNLKTRKSQNTPSTSANSESESERRYQRHTLHGNGHSHHHHRLSNAAGYTVTPRAHGENHSVRHNSHVKHGATTCRRDYHGSQLNCDRAPQHVPELRPGATRAPDLWQLDLRLNELRRQDLSHQRAPEHHKSSSWQNADHQQLNSYQHRHQVAAPRHSVTQSAYLDHAGPAPSWTTRVPQLDLNWPRSGVVAWC